MDIIARNKYPGRKAPGSSRGLAQTHAGRQNLTSPLI